MMAVEPEPGLVPFRVVVDDRAHAVATVKKCEPKHREIPDLPKRAGPTTSDECEVDALDTTVEDIHDEQVAKDQENQNQTGNPHEEPAIQLEVAALLIA